MRTWLILFVLLTSCSLGEQTTQNTLTDSAGNSILFLVLKIRKDPAQGKNTVELLSKTVSAGKIKREAPPTHISNSYLTIDVYRKNRIVHTLMIEHPLYKHIEYAAENGVLASKDVELDEAEFFIRMQSQGDMVKISETLPHKAETTLIKLKL